MKAIFQIMQEICYMAMVGLRTLKYKLLFSKLGKGSIVHGKIFVKWPKNVEMGEYSTLNEGVMLDARAKIKIGNDVHISSGVIINTGGLDDYFIHYTKNVTINDNVWICSGAIINPGVTIDEGSIIASGAVVNKDVEKNVLIVGIPGYVKKVLDQPKEKKHRSSFQKLKNVFGGFKYE